MQNYSIPENFVETEYTVKKSRFIARAQYAPSREAAMAFLDKARSDYPDARHHCWAYIIGHPANPETIAFSDDGEPSGTAGKPILNVMQHKPVGDIVIVVVRYFGGIKLGAGGLVRAYSSATQQAYSELDTREHASKRTLIIRCAYKDEQRVRHEIGLLQGLVEDIRYEDKAVIRLSIPETVASTLRDKLNSLQVSYGKIEGESEDYE